MSEDTAHMMLVYDDPSDQRSLSLDDTSSVEESPDETRLSLETTSDDIPYIGQRFATHDAAYEFYSEFAKKYGFSIRRHRTKDSSSHLAEGGNMILIEGRRLK